VADPVAVILAAGKSTRMKSAIPKVLHGICGRPMIEFVLDAARDAGCKRMVVIVGHEKEMVKEALAGHADVEFAEQIEQHGTGHAVMMCEENLKDHDGPTLILAGDTPLLTGASLTALLEEQSQQSAACVIGTADTADNDGLGRVVRGAGGRFECIVEQKDASDEQLQITEINTGCYAFDNQKLLAALTKIRPENTQAEYYLTDCPAILLDEGHPVIASCSLDISEAMGVNNRVQLATVTATIQQRILEDLMVNGVTIINPKATYIDSTVKIGRDSIVHPYCVLTGDIKIGEGCTIGPHAVIDGPATLPDGRVVEPFQSL
jgi:bifunctional UDP-N-acetylglucosamine pyrophosphorylase/glucosamine-1-phosphate N-acetyltransferase